MNPVQIINGKENPTSGDSSLVIYCFHDGKENYLANMIGRKLPGGEVMKVNEPVYEPSLAGHKPEIAGRWVTQTFLLPNDLILVVSGNKRRTWQDGGRPARLILRIRDKAAMRQVEFTTLQLSVSTKGTVNAVKGRFDVLPLDEARKLGFVPNPMDLDHYTQASCAAQFQTKILEPELEVRQTTEIKKVGEHSIKVSSRQRRI